MEDIIDFVVTWVDGNDNKWLEEKRKYEVKSENHKDELFDIWNNNEIRYRDWDNLKYWFRGVEKFAPWVNKIHFVTYGHIPDWLNTNNKKMNIVNHKDFIPEKYLPTFNSNAIELNLHRINELSDKFVYFNDDMFLINKTKKTDFFKNGLPCETAALDCVSLDWNVGHAEIRNMQILNKYFEKRKVIKNNLKGWINLKYGKQLIKTLVLLPWDRFTGLYESHLPCSYIKCIFDELWNKEHTVFENTCMNKFRTESDINHWLIKSWQIATANFYPRKPNIGKMFLKEIDNEILDSIQRQKYKIVCVNDFQCSNDDYIIKKRNLNNAFEKILPEKCSFEK